MQAATYATCCWAIGTWLVCSVGCQTHEPTPADAHASTDASTEAVVLDVRATVGDALARCGTVYTGLGSSGSSAQLADARLFVSNLTLQNSAGQWQPVQLDASIWQHKGVALLDFEDATAACKDTGTPQTNQQLTGRVPAGTYTRLRLDVGVPFDQNHTDNALAEPPLSTPGMFWTWQAGYKFVRVDWQLQAGKRWNVHVGATGCSSQSPVQGPKLPCARPNLARIEVALPSGPQATLQLDLGQLLQGVDLTADTTGTAAGCMSGQGEAADCAGSWQALGMDFATGSCVAGCAGQSILQVAP